LIKVLILSHSSELAGAERSMLDLFDYWVKKYPIEPHFIIRRPVKGLSKELRKRKWGYTALYYTNWSDRTSFEERSAESIYRSSLFNTKAIFDIEKLITNFKPDIVMTNTIVSPWAAVSAHFQKIPHIWFVREYGDLDHRHIFELGREKMFEDIDTLSSLVVTNSKTLARHVEQYITPSKIEPLYTPFDTDYLRRKSKAKASSPFKNDKALKLVITGRIAQSKGQADAAEAVGKLIRMGYDTELCVIGLPSDPEDANSLHEAIKKYEIENKIHLVGHQSNPLSILKYADIGVMASKQEAFGRVTFEYMAVGLPVIGANSGATPELIRDGRTGYLYEQGDIENLTEQLVKYAKNRDLVVSHGKAAMEHAEEMMAGEYNADNLYKKTTTVIEGRQEHLKPLNFAHRWLEYPVTAQKYIQESGVISLRRMVYLSLRHRAKIIYLLVANPINKITGRKLPKT
jgi:glycosyltransferase involved in cell wall biosynthesis